MANGAFLGGIAEGVNAAEARRLRGEEVAISRSQAELARERLAFQLGEAQEQRKQQLAEQLRASINTVFAEAQKVVDNHLEGGGSVKDPQLQKAVSAITGFAIQQAEKAATMGLGIDPNLYRIKQTTLLTAPSQVEAARAEGAATGAGKVAEGQVVAASTEQSLAEAMGVEQEEAGMIRVVAGDSPLNETLGLGIPENENARVRLVMDPQTGLPVRGEVLGRFGSGEGVTVNVGTGEGTAFGKEGNKAIVGQLDSLIADGKNAVTTSQSLVQAAELIAGGVETGSLQPLVTSLQGVAEDLGINLEGIAQALRIDLGSLSDKQEFDRLATQVIIEGFDKFKGNLNQKEVDLAVNAFGNLGRSEEANIDAIAAGLAAAQLAIERGRQASEALFSESPEPARNLLGQVFGEGETDRFRALKQGFESQLRFDFEQSRKQRAKQPSGGGAQAPTQAPTALPKTIEEVEALSVDEARRLITNASDEELEALPATVLLGLQQKLRGDQ